MRIYWWIMTGLLLFPWMLAIMPPAVAVGRRVALKANGRCHMFS